MKIITCFKLVPEEQDIVVTPEQALSFDNADTKISQFDLNAIEAATQLASDAEDEIAALTVGGSLLQNSKVRKDVLSRGPHALYLMQDAQLEHALPKDTAQHRGHSGKIGFDLILFGEGSGDLYAQQVGLLVGEILQLPTINAVSSLQRQGDKLVVERTLEEDVEVIELSLPAVLCVTSDINVPRIPP